MSSLSQLGDPASGLSQQNFAERQLFALKATAKRLFATPLGTALTIAVVAISLALPATFFLCISSLQDLGISWRGNTRITVYLEQSVSDKAGAKMALQMLERDDINSAIHISKKQAASDFIKWTGFDDLLASLEQNPLPGAIVIEPAIDLKQTQAVEELAASLIAEDGIESADLDIRWLERLNGVIRLLNTGIAVAAALLALAVVITVGNTLRLDVQSRREEIAVSQLVGASDHFLQKPFMFSGMLYGLCGGILAAILTTIAIALLNRPVSALAIEYQSSFQLSGLGFTGFFTVIASGTLLGLGGAWLTARQHIERR